MPQHERNMEIFHPTIMIQDEKAQIMAQVYLDNVSRQPSHGSLQCLEMSWLVGMLEATDSSPHLV